MWHLPRKNGVDDSSYLTDARSLISFRAFCLSLSLRPMIFTYTQKAKAVRPLICQKFRKKGRKVLPASAQKKSEAETEWQREELENCSCIFKLLFDSLTCVNLDSNGVWQGELTFFKA